MNPNKKIVVTKTWTRANGQKIPLPLMSNDYIKNAYRRCVEVIYGNVSTEVTETGRYTNAVETPITKEKAIEWKAIFELEAKKRGMRLPRIDKGTYSIDFGNRRIRKKFKLLCNKNFDKKFK